MIGYCVKCRKKREMKNIHSSKTKKGVKMTKGTCTNCGTKMCCIGR
jgi:hypothetical protein